MMAIAGIATITALGYLGVVLAGTGLGLLESMALGWLLGSALTTTVIFLLGWLGMWGLLPAPTIAIALWAILKLQKESATPIPAPCLIPLQQNTYSLFFKVLIPILWLLILSQFLYSLLCSLALTTQYFDAFTFWSLRAKYFFYQGSLGLADEPNWMLGATNIHYPIHLPLLKALLCSLAGGWSEPWVLVVDIINLGAFLILVFYFIDGFFNRAAATIAVYLITSLPLVDVHLSAGFADLTVAIYIASSLIFWEKWRRLGDKKNLLLSGFLAAAAAWTKNDPIAIFFPVFFLAMALTRKWRAFLVCLGSVLLPLAPWVVFKEIIGLDYNPNRVSHIFEFHPEAIALYFPDFFYYGSFCILWIWTIPLLFWPCKPHYSKALWPMAWGCVIMVIAVFTFTVNFQYLQDSATSSRSLLQIAPLMIIAMAARCADILIHMKARK